MINILAIANEIKTQSLLGPVLSQKFEELNSNRHRPIYNGNVDLYNLAVEFRLSNI